MTGMSDNASHRQSVRRHAIVLLAQVALVALAVAASLSMPAGHQTTAVIMVIAVANGATVALGAMGVKRDGWMVSTLMAMTFFFIIGLLIWPAWDIAQRSRMF